MRVIELKKNEGDKLLDEFNNARQNMDERAVNLLNNLVATKGQYYEERQQEIYKAINRIRKNNPNLNLDMLSFVLGVVWCETHPSKEGIYRVLRIFFRQDLSKFSAADANYIYEILKEV